MSRLTTPTSEPSISNDELSDLILSVFAKVNPSGYKTAAEFQDHEDIVSGFPTLNAYEDLGASCMIFCAAQCGSLYEGYQQYIYDLYGYTETDYPDDTKFQKVDELIKEIYIALVSVNHPFAKLRLYPKNQMPYVPS